MEGGKVMKEILMVIGAGMLSGIISPFIVSWLQHKVIWKSQKKLEIKYSVFNNAVKALSQFATDALDPVMQKSIPDQQIQRITKTRKETDEMCQETRDMVKAFFSKEAHSLLDNALRTEISIQNAPNEEFERNRVKAIIAMSEELGIK